MKARRLSISSSWTLWRWQLNICETLSLIPTSDDRTPNLNMVPWDRMLGKSKYEVVVFVILSGNILDSWNKGKGVVS